MQNQIDHTLRKTQFLVLTDLKLPHLSPIYVNRAYTKCVLGGKTPPMIGAMTLANDRTGPGASA